MFYESVTNYQTGVKAPFNACKDGFSQLQQHKIDHVREGALKTNMIYEKFMI